MTDEEKKIEEIIHTIKDVNTIYVQEVDKDGDYDIGYSDRYAVNKNVAEAIYNAGYRKQSDTVREFVEKVKNIKLTILSTYSEYEFSQALLKAVSIKIDEIAEKYGIKQEDLCD